jgi:hypothetical protein
MKFLSFGIISSILCTPVILQCQAPILAQSTGVQVDQPTQRATEPIRVLSPTELDNLVAPIALYPDPLLSQVLAASTYPLEIVEAAQWLRQNSELTAAALQDAVKQQDWDASVQALVLFREVLDQLSDNIRWTTDLGNAFVAQQTGVMDAVQRMRNRAWSSGTLTSTPQTIVRTQPQDTTTVIEIQPANPQVIYVPVYDPLTIWGPAYYSYPVIYYPRRPVIVGSRLVSFSAGVFVGSLFTGWTGWGGWGWHPNWFGRTVVVNNSFFDRYGYRSVSVAHRYSGPAIWRHDQRRNAAIRYSNRVVVNRFDNNYRRPQVVRPQPPASHRSPGFFAPQTVPGPNIERRLPRASVPVVTAPVPRRSGPSASAPFTRAGRPQMSPPNRPVVQQGPSFRGIPNAGARQSQQNSRGDGGQRGRGSQGGARPGSRRR